MEGGDLKEAWRCLKGWYRNAGEHSPKPCYESMDKQTRERVELYGKVPPPGDHIPINVEPFKIRDAALEDVEIRVREIVRGMRNGRAGDGRVPPKSKWSILSYGLLG